MLIMVSSSLCFSKPREPWKFGGDPELGTLGILNFDMPFLFKSQNDFECIAFMIFLFSLRRGKASLELLNISPNQVENHRLLLEPYGPEFKYFL